MGTLKHREKCLCTVPDDWLWVSNPKWDGRINRNKGLFGTLCRKGSGLSKYVYFFVEF